MKESKKYYKKLALKHQLKKAIKYDYKYFEECIIQVMENFADQQFKDKLEKIIPSDEEINKKYDFHHELDHKNVKLMMIGSRISARWLKGLLLKSLK